MSTPESKVRDPVVAWAKTNGFMHVRMSFRPGVKRGVPDDLFIRGGVHCWVEFKAEGKQPTPLQSERIEQLQEHGATVFWTDNARDCIAALQLIVNMQTLLSANGGSPN